jgi:hypothetical protein
MNTQHCLVLCYVLDTWKEVMVVSASQAPAPCTSTYNRAPHMLLVAIVAGAKTRKRYDTAYTTTAQAPPLSTLGYPLSAPAAAAVAAVTVVLAAAAATGGDSDSEPTACCCC